MKAPRRSKFERKPPALPLAVGLLLLAARPVQAVDRLGLSPAPSFQPAAAPKSPEAAAAKSSETEAQKSPEAAAPARPPQPAPAAPASGKRSPLADMREAQQHFDLAITLYQEGDLHGALAEFRRAHATFPSYKVLYNLALLSRELYDWAGALRTYREYLDAGGSLLSPERRLQVERDMVELAQRVGRLEIEVRGGAAEVILDDQPIAAAGNTTVIVNPGRHRLRVTFPRRSPQVRVLEVASADKVKAVFEAPPARPSSARLVSKAAASAPTTLKDSAEPPGQTSRAVTWAWTATGLLGAGALGTALVGWDASQNLARERMKFPVDADTLKNHEQRTRRFALTADVLLGGTVLAALISIYLTVTAPAAAAPSEPASSLPTITAGVGDGSVAAGAHWRF